MVQKMRSFTLMYVLFVIFSFESACWTHGCQSVQAQASRPMPSMRFPNGVPPTAMAGQHPMVPRPMPGQGPMQPIPMTNGVISQGQVPPGPNPNQANSGAGPGPGGGGAPPGTPGTPGTGAQPNGIHAAGQPHQPNQAPGQPGQPTQTQTPIQRPPLGSTSLTATGAVGAGQRPGEGVSGSTGTAGGPPAGVGAPPFQSPTMAHPAAGPPQQGQPPMGMWPSPMMIPPGTVMPPGSMMVHRMPVMMPNGFNGQHPHPMAPPGHGAPMMGMHPHMPPHMVQPGQPMPPGAQPVQPVGQPGGPNVQRVAAATAESPRYAAGSRAGTPASTQPGGPNQGASNASASGSSAPGPNAVPPNSAPGGLHQSPSLANRQVGGGQTTGTPPGFSGARGAAPGGQQGRGAKRNSVSPGDDVSFSLFCFCCSFYYSYSRSCFGEVGNYRLWNRCSDERMLFCST